MFPFSYCIYVLMFVSIALSSLLLGSPKSTRNGRKNICCNRYSSLLKVSGFGYRTRCSINWARHISPKEEEMCGRRGKADMHFMCRGFPAKCDTNFFNYYDMYTIPAISNTNTINNNNNNNLVQAVMKEDGFRTPLWIKWKSRLQQISAAKRGQASSAQWLWCAMNG